MSASVRDLIRVRQAERSTRGHRTDPHHLALVIEGGGMRGVVAGGMVSALEARGLFDCFDSVHGSSAGACAGAYFTVGEAPVGTSIYYEDINNRQFIDVRRALIGRPVMNTHFLIDHVMRVPKPLRVDKILSQPGFLHVVVTDAHTAQGRIYSQFREVEHFFRILKGSITIPVIAGAPIEVDGVPLVDGGMVQQIALESAVAVGATHVLVLMTRREGELERIDQPVRMFIESLLLRLLYNGALASTYGGRSAKINEIVERIVTRAPGEKVLIESIVRPANASDVNRLTIDGALLRAADKEAQQAVFHYLDGGR